MVYHGPSKGCRACRKRRVKCDEGKPACNNCIRRKVECPGYESTFDYRHRNETDTTIQKVQQKVEQSRRKSDTSEITIVVTGSPPDVEAIQEKNITALTHINDDQLRTSEAEWAITYPALSPTPQMLDYTSPVGMTLDHDPELTCLTWYFTNYPWKAIDPQSTHGIVSLLKPLYLASPKDSPLRPAVTALASNLFMLFGHQGSDTNLSRKFYAQSISRMKTAIADPRRSKEDDLLLAALTLNFNDTINLRWNHDLENADNHKGGAIALLKHRGRANYDSERSRYLTSCIRSAICHWSLDTGVPVSPDVYKWLFDDSVPMNKTSELDVLTFKFVNLRHRFNTFCEKAASCNPEAEAMIKEGLEIDNEFVDWAERLPSHWRPVYATAEEVLPSIRAAGFYGHRCAIYWDLSICDTWNEFRTRRLGHLRLIRQLCRMVGITQYAEELKQVEANMQTLIDEQCEVVPIMFGDMLGPIRHGDMYNINYPSASNGIATYPNPDHDHPRAAASSGGWLISATLVAVAKLGVKEGHFDPFVMREGQFEWILGQLQRMKAIFLLSQPQTEKTWESFRRS